MYIHNAQISMQLQGRRFDSCKRCAMLKSSGSNFSSSKSQIIWTCSELNLHSPHSGGDTDRYMILAAKISMQLKISWNAQILNFST